MHLAVRPAGLSAALLAPGVTSYTAALLSRTAVPAWNDAHRELPFVFTGSAAAAEVVASRLIDRRPGFVTEAYTTGRPHRLRKASEYLTLGGAVTAMSLARRNRVAAAVGGLAC
ncbi:hypothetical protein [Streptomyces spiralis]|uniref:hypothetical protein n=1 Tax=Streptomyces spiralis TaxID=66376 RepID=UPI001675C9F3|nr:hypothetical protein [Streptomyces spiralis]